MKTIWEAWKEVKRTHYNILCWFWRAKLSPGLLQTPESHREVLCESEIVHVQKAVSSQPEASSDEGHGDITCTIGVPVRCLQIQLSLMSAEEGVVRALWMDNRQEAEEQPWHTIQWAGRGGAQTRASDDKHLLLVPRSLSFPSSLTPKDWFVFSPTTACHFESVGSFFLKPRGNEPIIISSYTASFLPTASIFCSSLKGTFASSLVIRLYCAVLKGWYVSVGLESRGGVYYFLFYCI